MNEFKALRALAQRWCRPAPPNPAHAGLGDELPVVLREWYAQVFRGLESIQDQALPPEKLEIVDDYLLVWDGVQGVAPHWFLKRAELSLDDPPVYVGDADGLEYGVEQEAEHLSTFLIEESIHDLLSCLVEFEGDEAFCVLGHAIEGAHAASVELKGQEDVDRIEARYPRLEFPCERVFGVFGDADTLIFLFRQGNAHHLAAGRTPEALAELGRHATMR